VQILLRELIPTGTAGGTYRDREIDTAEVTLGSGADCTVQVFGSTVRRRHATLRPAGDGFDLACKRGATVLVNGTPARSGHLAPGTTVELEGARLRVATPPPGFAGALEFEPQSEVSARAFEAAFVTDLEQTRLARRTPAWILGLGLLAIGLLIPWFVPLDSLPWWTSDEVWSSGPLLPAHAVAVGNDCGACHEQPFQRVQDTACTECHRDVTDHAPAPLQSHVGLDGIRCASCHKEHNTPVHITITADALCTDCHAAPDWPDNRLAAASGFTEATHPAFAVDLLASTHEPRGTGFAYRWNWQSSPLADAEDPSNLKYPHDVHLDPGKVQHQVTGQALGCGDCHTLQADGEHFAPIRMEQHCRACHDLKFDRAAPDRELPHANPSEALLVMEGHYMRLYADPDARQPTRERRRLPDRTRDTDRCDGPAYQCARERTAREAENQFTVRGCVTCHEVTVHDTDDLLGRYQVAPVRLTPDFFTAAHFDHRAHFTQRDATGDAACLTCHEADGSTASTDVLMPDIQQCVTCHGDHRQADLVPLDCVDCHSFHPGVLHPSVATEAAE
jgi:predicted CXXCH cytochrome family protein